MCGGFNILCVLCCESKYKIVYVWCPFKLVISSSPQIFYLVCLQSCVGTKWSSSHYSSVLCYLAEKYQTEKVTMYSRSQRYQRHHCQRVVALIIWTSILSLHTGCANHHRSKSKFLYEIWLFYEGVRIVILWVLTRRASVSGEHIASVFSPEGHSLVIWGLFYASCPYEFKQQ